MSEQLANLQAMLGGLSPTELLQLSQALQAQVKTVSEQLSEAKKSFLAECCEALEGIEPPEACTVAVSFDETGKIIERSYKSGTMKKSSVSTGTGHAKENHTPTPEVGSLCLRTYHGTQHTLLVRGEGDYLLDGKVECNSPTGAYKMVLGNPKASVDGRKFWFVEGKIQAPSAK
jgi:hypothetical protein